GRQKKFHRRVAYNLSVRVASDFARPRQCFYQCRRQDAAKLPADGGSAPARISLKTGIPRRVYKSLLSYAKVYPQRRYLLLTGGSKQAGAHPLPRSTRSKASPYTLSTGGSKWIPPAVTPFRPF